MSERIVVSPVSSDYETGYVVESFFRGRNHPGQRECPECHSDSVQKTGIVNLVYSFMKCDCNEVDYVHLVERLWHPVCYVAAFSAAEAQQREGAGE